MAPDRIARLRTGAAKCIVALVLAAPASGQEYSLNYERLSSLEEPLATEIGDVTFVLTGLVDAAGTHGAEDRRDSDVAVTANVQASALTQLSNRWRVAVRYFGQHVTGDAPSLSGGDGDVSNAAVSIGGAWGTVIGGNVAGLVREQTRRLRGAGNALLIFDDALGATGDVGGSYVGRFGPWVVSFTVDEGRDVDLGAVYQRPFGNKDYRLAIRATQGGYQLPDDSRRFDTKSVGLVAELIFGSWLIDAGIGYERLVRTPVHLDRRYASAGVRTKAGRVTVSVAGHLGRIAGTREVAAALGLQYDLARGLSLNLGLNHADSRVRAQGFDLTDVKDTEASISVRYSF